MKDKQSVFDTFGAFSLLVTVGIVAMLLFR